MRVLATTETKLAVGGEKQSRPPHIVGLLVTQRGRSNPKRGPGKDEPTQ